MSLSLRHSLADLLLRPACQCIAQNAHDVQRLACRQIPDLMTATRPVGNDNRVLAGSSHRRQQRRLCHFARYVDMFRLVTEGTGHTATAGLDRFDFEIRNHPQNIVDRRHDIERFLVAVPVNERMFLW